MILNLNLPTIFSIPLSYLLNFIPTLLLVLILFSNFTNNNGMGTKASTLKQKQNFPKPASVLRTEVAEPMKAPCSPHSSTLSWPPSRMPHVRICIHKIFDASKSSKYQFKRYDCGTNDRFTY